MTAAELLGRRHVVRAELEEGRGHLLMVLRKPDEAVKAAPVGDVLCWANGLEEAKVSRILAAAEIPWGRPTASLRKREVEMLCLQIKARHPETWQRWRDAVKRR
ncbi:MAG TPA: hypothetical protein VFI09_07070 [Solirubrobacterales bacterium]|nr:hypothetical protein [Solirubrobacterales bacterium]